ncbi:MAG: T9SS type A sorting domain-containing protein [Bacteroidetes bacterium]|nr:T9SS type A sorting domain-containing protein [Bacteroidota bacterium]
MKSKSFLVKLVIAFIFVIISSNFSNVYAGPGDTIHVQTFTYGSVQDAKFLFPSDTIPIEKILMHYKLRCPYIGQCGEWDYLTYTYLYDHTGVLDSNLLSAPSYIWNNTSPDSISFMNQPSWIYMPNYAYNIVYDNTISFDSAIVGNGSTQTVNPFGSAKPVSRTQYLWRANELLTAGLNAGNISSLRFNLQSFGSELKHLTIRIKNTTQDSLYSNSYENGGFTTVYSNNTQFNATGWANINFTLPFNWNGTSNIVIEITYDNDIAGTNNVLLSQNTTWNSGVNSSGDDKSLFFSNTNWVDVPKQAFSNIDSIITVSFWQYGNPAFQPQDNTLFEGLDSLGNRVVNVHLPWSDGNVYWDAGNVSGSYDRLNKLAIAANYKGQWNYWSFIKNATTGSMKIYLNGHLWTSSTAKTRAMKGIKTFHIGGGAGGTMLYDGNVDEFAVWNAELDSNTIKAWMYKDLNATHPFNSNLQVYYKFNSNSFVSTPDSSGHGNSGILYGPPVPTYVSGNTLFRNFTNTSLRPNIIFEQGVYISHIDSLMVIDSIPKAPMQIIMFGDTTHPTTPTDTMTVWPTYYNNYSYNSAGIPTDSTLVPADSTIHLNIFHYYGPHFEVIDRYELGRYITPYGNNLSLGSGFTWTFDMSDYRSLLKDSVHLAAGNWQELLDMSFDFIEGTPPRDVLSVKNLWNGGFNYGDNNDPIESHLTPKKVFIPANAVNARWKSRITGHGMDTPSNCAEFCPKTHYFKVNGTQQFSQLVWRDNCGENPVFPQGGTWVYDRSNWCPGAEVATYDFELSPFITPNDSLTLDHDVQPYVHSSGWDYFQIEDQLITYGAPHFTLDAAVYNIKSPSTNDMYKRMNPVCNKPLITIKNTGSTALTSLTITYGLEGLPQSTFNWTGNLKFMESQDVTLDSLIWSSSSTKFQVTVSNPNGGTDQYSYNNTMKSKVTFAPNFPSVLIFQLQTNNCGYENSYTLTDDAGNIILSRSGLLNNYLYKDTVNLIPGCYIFKLLDNDDDGLAFWAATSDGNGSFKIMKPNSNIPVKAFGGDFGSMIFQHFNVLDNTAIFENEEMNFIEIYPNPSKGSFNFDVNLSQQQDIKIVIYDIMGKEIYTEELKDIISANHIIELGNLSNGIYFAKIQLKSGLINKRMVINR